MSFETAVRVTPPAAQTPARVVTAPEAELQRRVAVLETELAALREHDRRQSARIAEIERILGAAPGGKEMPRG